MPPPRTDPHSLLSYQPLSVTPVTSLAQNEILWFEPESKTQLLTRNNVCHALITYLNHRKLMVLPVDGGKKVFILKYPRDAALHKDMSKHFLERLE